MTYANPIYTNILQLPLVNVSIVQRTNEDLILNVLFQTTAAPPVPIGLDGISFHMQLRHDNNDAEVVVDAVSQLIGTCTQLITLQSGMGISVAITLDPLHALNAGNRYRFWSRSHNFWFFDVDVTSYSGGILRGSIVYSNPDSLGHPTAYSASDWIITAPFDWDTTPAVTAGTEAGEVGMLMLRVPKTVVSKMLPGNYVGDVEAYDLFYTRVCVSLSITVEEGITR